MQNDVQLNLMEQDYRQYGLLANPTDVGTKRRLSISSSVVSFEVVFDNVSDMAIDDQLISNNTYYRVIRIEDTTVTLQQMSQIFRPIEVGDTFTNPDDQFALYSVLSVEADPVVDKYSGNLLYASNVAPFIPSDDQLISVRTYIKL
jgi:hypothetical protein